MNTDRDLLIRGSEKVIGHYEFLLANAKADHERKLYRQRIERERRLISDLQGEAPHRAA
ncbi:MULTISPECIES: hypothetical protein [unclassified Bradyrhizobium]|uniref:hypothetical protein n=1 Tax=unclassified Bradyrhizobium TaxID=2631580 RepID=UPI002479E1EB|nr:MULTISPECIES: hypothetical protein [unclassified Bradyrhizobium]WGR70036.1 hypothetical protein MTX24_32285 [Bradyrhizobium sp. ISRA426]WGR82093.1 hypothetical protein MTX21_17390 [Bradyrhizobium sp. ISRA430]WGR85279.1 hypothetical protein MTX25_31960 [Bradyrhizobium sp. ISRA432]